jgi:hypothetical protein
MDVKGTVFDVEDWIHLALSKIQWWAFAINILYVSLSTQMQLLGYEA